MTEHEHQAALFKWASMNKYKHPELDLMFAIPNGGARHIAVAKKLKAEGVKAGVPDIFLPVPRENTRYSVAYGLFIEMKKPGGKIGKRQMPWIDALYKQGYACEICYGWEEAKDVIINYLGKGIT